MAMEREYVWTMNNHYLVTGNKCFEDLLFKQVYGSQMASSAGSTTCSNGDTAKTNLNQALAYLAHAGIKLSAEVLDVAVARKRQIV